MTTTASKTAMRFIAMSLAMVVLVTMACGASILLKETRTNTFSVGSSPVVKVTVGNGDIDFVVGPAGEITVEGELRDAKNVDYKVSQEGDAIMVDAKTKRGGRANMTVTAPENTRFDLSTGNGEVKVAGVQASGKVKTGNGSIKLEKIRGDVVGNTGNGDITVRDVVGSYDLNDGNGRITLSGVSGSFVVNDGNGKVTLSDATGSFVVNLGNGDISFQGELTAGSDNKLASGNGSVTVELTGSPSLALDLETDDGDIEVGLPVTIDHQAEGELVGTIGSGDAALTVDVGRGDITVK